jgi:type I restriction enzyme S subunit
MSYPAYPANKESGVEWLGEIPGHWNITPLKFSASCNDAVLPDSTDEDYEIKYVEISDVNEISGITGSTSYKFSDAPSRARRMLQDGDVLISTVRTYLRAIAPVVTPPENLIASTGFAVVRPRKGILDGTFLGYLLRAEWWISEVIARSVGVSYPAINASDLIGLNVPVPAWHEQIQIARFLDHETARIDALIEEQQRLIELLKEKRQAVISHSVTKGLDPTVPMKDSGVEWLGEVPAHWRSRKVKRLFAQSKRQGYTDMEVLSVYRDYGVVKKNSRDDNNNKTPDDLSLYQLVMAGDLVVNKMKAWQGSLGVSEYQGITSPDYVVYSPSHGEAPKFLHYLLRASHMPKVYLSISNGIRPSQWRIEPEKFEQVEVFLPGKREQLEIVTYLENQLTRINELMLCCEQASNFFSERRSALISAAVTGKIDVRGWQPLASAPTPELAQEAV